MKLSFSKYLFFLIPLIEMMTINVFGSVTAPTAGAGFDLYDLVVNDFIQGPVGIALSIGLLGFGGWLVGAKQQIWGGAGAGLGGALILGSERIATSMAVMII